MSQPDVLVMALGWYSGIAQRVLPPSRPVLVEHGYEPDRVYVAVAEAAASVLANAGVSPPAGARHVVVFAVPLLPADVAASTEGLLDQVGDIVRDLVDGESVLTLVRGESATVLLEQFAGMKFDDEEAGQS